MEYSVDFTYRGLFVMAKLEPYDPGDRMQPPEGGAAYEVEWEVEDIDELLLHLELSTEGLDNMVRAHYRLLGHLPKTLATRIERDWGDDLLHEATEFFWNDAGGPSGYKDYSYDD